MDKEKQIEEMYNAFLEYKFTTPIDKFSYKGAFEHFIKQGYCKITENEVVISKEEYENLKKEVKEMEKQRDEQAYMTEDLIQEKHLWTEQTAEKFARKVKELINILKTELHASGEEYLGIEDFDIDQIANNIEWI